METKNFHLKKYLYNGTGHPTADVPHLLQVLLLSVLLPCTDQVVTSNPEGPIAFFASIFILMNLKQLNDDFEFFYI